MSTATATYTSALHLCNMARDESPASVLTWAQKSGYSEDTLKLATHMMKKRDLEESSNVIARWLEFIESLTPQLIEHGENI